MTKQFAIAVALAAIAATPALAQDGAVRSAHDAIVGGNYVKAEQLLTAERQIYPGNAEVLVNLAAVYTATGRQMQAATLYRQVLDQDAVLLDRGDKSVVSSHQIAKAGLGRISAYQTAAR
ncbi:tetratricopeptide repeat protein [uncultured Sphingomonas sp.]|uniref:tetratricopeptide repeat protein n=1 Tax=uncultured Sphingomonas sp. TaxID=158754 RepID=UPI0025DA9132|nr:tetratricopeptide repeat protein [uncultured Sphingomonas sp.]